MSNLDTTSKIPRKGAGRFQWNLGGWLGSQIGGSCWMLACAFLLLPHSLPLALVWLACFVGANAVGSYLYAGRDRWLPYPCLQILIATLWIAGMIAWTSLVVFRIDLLPLMQTRSPWTGYLCLLIAPAIMLSFHFQESHPTHIRSVEKRTEFIEETER